MITTPLINRTTLDGTAEEDDEEAVAKKTLAAIDDHRLYEVIVMSERKTRIRRRASKSRRDGVSGGGGAMPHTGEDLMAIEPQLDSATGPHMPLIYRSSFKDSDYDRVRDEVGIPWVFVFGMLYVIWWTVVTRGLSVCTSKYSPVDETLSWFARTRKNLKGDFSSICLLLFLYLLQGIPLGLIAAIPLILQDRHVSYQDQAIFSFAYWPFSLKLLWAPIVDSVYWKKLGRRKSWMVPCQYLIGIFMLVLSYQVSNIIGSDEKHVNVFFLMSVFLPLNFLAATQDIAVDGWALTMLSRKNVGYASTCNAVGQTAGFFLGNVVFLTLDSESFANKWIRSVPAEGGLIDLAGFVFFWGWVFIVTTTFVLLFKKEVDHSQTPESKEENGEAGGDDEMELGVVDTYLVLFKIFKLKPMFWMIVVLLTGKMVSMA
uniref:MFS general substrate transporter n=1 Tax=Steinernema glaseri TaxID=37863 RepID=A0A1I7ZLJ0_9BILA